MRLELATQNDFGAIIAFYEDVTERTPEMAIYARWSKGKHPTIEGIRAYIDDTKRRCRDLGYVTTLFGRVCHYPQIRSNNPNERASVERQAINAPIQGSAADIIRRAMVRMEQALRAVNVKL